MKSRAGHILQILATFQLTVSFCLRLSENLKIETYRTKIFISGLCFIKCVSVVFTVK
jgi:hypothetical protein